MRNRMRGIAALCAENCILAAIGCVMLMDAYAEESGENVTIACVLLLCCLAANIVCIFRDWGKIVSLVSFALAAASFAYILAGRISYLAFFMSGDVMGTGLSLFLLLALLFVLGAAAADVVAMCAKNTEGGERK